jgi:hypothetical protein
MPDLRREPPTLISSGLRAARYDSMSTNYQCYSIENRATATATCAARLLRGGQERAEIQEQTLGLGQLLDDV